MTRTFTFSTVLFTSAVFTSAQPPVSLSTQAPRGEQQTPVWRLADDLLATDNHISFNQGSRRAWYPRFLYRQFSPTTATTGRVGLTPGARAPQSGLLTRGPALFTCVRFHDKRIYASPLVESTPPPH